MNILIAGVGGQGIILASKIIGDALMLSGKDVVVSEIHGMAQRGGAVESAVRTDAMGPILPNGKADVLLAFEPLEALRHVQRISKDGIVIMNSRRIVPINAALGSEKYPSIEEMEQKIQKHCKKLIKLDAYELAQKAGAAVTANIVMIGALFSTGTIQIPEEKILEAIKGNVPAKYVEVNERAFRFGVQSAR